jgi:hypothetical protein
VGQGKEVAQTTYTHVNKYKNNKKDFKVNKLNHCNAMFFPLTVIQLFHSFQPI